jgi:hypothetical protein
MRGQKLNAVKTPLRKRRASARQLDDPAELEALYLENGDARTVIIEILQNPNTPEHILEEAINRGERSSLSHVVYNPNLSPRLVEKAILKTRQQTSPSSIHLSAALLNRRISTQKALDHLDDWDGRAHMPHYLMRMLATSTISGPHRQAVLTKLIQSPGMSEKIEEILDVLSDYPRRGTRGKWAETCEELLRYRYA